MVHHKKDEICTKLTKKGCRKKQISKHVGQKVKLSSASIADSNIKAIYSQQNNPILEKHLTIAAPPIDCKIFKDFRHYIFEPIKVNHAVQAIAEQAKTDIDYRTIRYSQLAKREVLQILYEKLLKHKWGDAAVILESYAYVSWRRLIPEACGDEYFKWRWQPILFNHVGREVLHNHPLAINDPNLRFILNRSLNFFGIALDTSEIAIENGFVQLARLDFDAANNCLSVYDYIDKSEHNKEKRRQIALEKKNLVDTYVGIINYCKWQNALQFEGSNGLQVVTGNSEPGLAIEIADAMTECFKDLWSSNGVWDIAMTKNIEVLEHSYQLVLLRKNLSLYSEHHQNNPNAHRYLYFFLKNHSVEDEESYTKLRFSALKRLQKVAPSDSSILDLHLLYQHLNKVSTSEKMPSKKKMHRNYLKSFSVIMNMLDHPCTLDSIEPWRELHKQLSETKDVLSKSCFSKLIKDLWVKSGRKTWWPRLHFCSNQALKTAFHTDQEFIKAKAFVASTFMGPKCQFCLVIEQNI